MGGLMRIPFLRYLIVLGIGLCLGMLAFAV